MTATFKVLSAILSYPDAPLVEAVPALRAALAAEALLPAPAAAALAALLDEIAAADPLDLAERYVDLFDRTRSLSLHLFEHVHGEGRDRGQAMVDLLGHYERHGLSLTASELPDYLPALLEFLSLVPAAEARGLLAETAHILAALRDRLARRGSAYAGALAALVALAGGVPAADAVPDETDGDDPADLAKLDAAWEDAPVTFGPGNPAEGCTRAADMLRRMGAPAAPAAVR